MVSYLTTLFLGKPPVRSLPVFIAHFSPRTCSKRERILYERICCGKAGKSIAGQQIFASVSKCREDFKSFPGLTFWHKKDTTKIDKSYEQNF